MNHTRLAMNERIKNLREQSENTRPAISIERAILLTEAYQKYAGRVSIPMLRALSFKHIIENKTICINNLELIVGERGPGPQQTPTYPELCCHTVEDLAVINSREKISFAVAEQVITSQQDKIIPFWNGKSMRDRIFNLMDKRWKDCYFAGLFTEFMEQRAPGHTVVGNKLFCKGMLDLKAEIYAALNSIDYLNDRDAYSKTEQLKAMAVCADALIVYAARHAEKARELAKTEKSTKRKKELLEIAATCDKVPASAPESFPEALQHYWFIHLGVIIELNTWDSFSPGRLDQHLFPFYCTDLAAGSLTRDRAKELLECFWIKFNNQPAPPKVGITLQESATYTDFANISLGGLQPDGSDGVNDVTYLLLEVIDELRLLQPSTNIQVSKKSSDRFLRESGRVIRQGWGQPSVFNADAVIQELLNQGKSLLDARAGGISGCVETGSFGRESYILTGYFNLVKVMEITINRGKDPQSGKILGPDTGDPQGFKSFDDLLKAFEQQLSHFIDIKIAGNQVIEKLYAEEMPAPFLSLIIEDCIQNGLDYNAGGARYNTSYIQGVGIGSLTDSMTALKLHLFEENNISWKAMLSALDSNYVESERLRQHLINNTPHYGNDNDYADEVMQQLFNLFYNAVNGRKTVRGGTYRINMLPTTCHVYFGKMVGATADGRKASQPLSEGISPVQGVDLNGPTAVIKSAAKMDHLATGGTLLNMKFTPQLLEGNKGLDALVSLIRSYFRMDGHHIQFNVVDRETLINAQRNPEQYRSLIVRVAGYSDYFNNLNEQLQNEIISRTAHGIN